jgi:hypothetical protein
MAAVVKRQAQMRGAVESAIERARRLWRDWDGRGVARRWLWQCLELPFDYLDALTVALGDLVQARGLGKGRLAALDGLLERHGDVSAQSGGIGSLVGGDGGQGAVLDGELVDLLDGVAAGEVELRDKAERALQVRGEELGVVEEVVDCGLGIRVRRRLGRHVGQRSSIVSHGVALRGARWERDARGARETRQPRVDGVGEEKPGNRQRGRDATAVGGGR